MNKILKNIILSIGVVLLEIVLILNIIYITGLSVVEIATVSTNNIIYLLVAIILSGSIYKICKLLKSKDDKMQKKHIVLGIIIVIYVIIQIVWINYRQSSPSDDQKTTYETAVSMVQGNLIEFIQEGTTYGGFVTNIKYLQSYNQQFTIAFMWSILFRILGSTSFYVIAYFNAICNGMTILAIYLICKELSKKYNINKYLAIVLITTFVTLPLLSVFIYGDLSSLTFALFAIYFIMKYTREEKNIYARNLSNMYVNFIYA